MEKASGMRLEGKEQLDAFDGGVLATRNQEVVGTHRCRNRSGLGTFRGQFGQTISSPGDGDITAAPSVAGEGTLLM